MGTISIIEFGVYGFVCYSSLLMLIISTIKSEIPTGRLVAITRSFYMMPGLICAGVLASSGVNIQMTSLTQSDIIRNLNDTSTWSDTATNTVNIVLQNPVWITIHFLFFAVMLIYIITNIINLMTKTE